FGLIFFAISEALSSGRNALRKITMSIANKNKSIGSVIHPTRLKKIGDDVVDYDVAMRQILSDLNPYPVAVRFLQETDAGDGRIAASCLQVGDIGGTRIRGKYRRPVFERGEQDSSGVVDDRIAIPSDRLRIDVLKRGRQVERPAAIS